MCFLLVATFVLARMLGWDWTTRDEVRVLQQDMWVELE